MNQIFNPENSVMQLINKIVSSVYLNILWFICCLPVVTAGASTTALFYVTLKMVKNEEGHLTEAFFHAFKQDFKQSTLVWLILLAIGIVLVVDGYALYHLRFENVFWTLITAVFIVAVVAYFIILMYIFPLMSHFDNTIPAMFKNSLIIGMRFLLCTVFMTCIYFVMTVIIVRFLTPAIIFGEGFCALMCSYLLSNIMRLLEDKQSPEVSSTDT